MPPSKSTIKFFTLFSSIKCIRTWCKSIWFFFQICKVCQKTFANVYSSWIKIRIIKIESIFFFRFVKCVRRRLLTCTDYSVTWSRTTSRPISANLNVRRAPRHLNLNIILRNTSGYTAVSYDVCRIRNTSGYTAVSYDVCRTRNTSGYRAVS